MESVLERFKIHCIYHAEKIVLRMQGLFIWNVVYNFFFLVITGTQWFSNRKCLIFQWKWPWPLWLFCGSVINIIKSIHVLQSISFIYNNFSAIFLSHTHSYIGLTSQLVSVDVRNNHTIGMYPVSLLWLLLLHFFSIIRLNESHITQIIIFWRQQKNICIRNTLTKNYKN